MTSGRGKSHSGRYKFKSQIEKARDSLTATGLNEHILGLRNGMEAAFVDIQDVDPDIRTRRRWVNAGRNAVLTWRRAFRFIELGFDYLDVVLTVLAVLQISIVFYVLRFLDVPQLQSILIAGIAYLLLRKVNSARYLTEALFEDIKYGDDEFSVRLDGSRLRFRAGWNKGVMNSTLAWVAIIIGALFRAAFPKLAERGIVIGMRWSSR